MMDWRTQARIIHETVATKWAPYSAEDKRFLVLALAGEVGELANVVKKEWRGDWDHFAWAPDRWAAIDRALAADSIPRELADIRIYLELVALAFGVDLDAECAAKVPELVRRWPETAGPLARAAAGEGRDA